MTALPQRVRQFFVRSKETATRLKRTAIQVIAGGALGGVIMAAFGGGEDTLKGAAVTAAGVFIAAYAQNTAEDVKAIKDRRPKK